MSSCRFRPMSEAGRRVRGATNAFIDLYLDGMFQYYGPARTSSRRGAIMKRIFGLLAIVALSLAARPAVAHHALQAEFDTAKRGEFTGTLTKLAMINPHVRWFFDAKKPDATVSKWEITGAGPQALRSNGMTRIFH